MGVFRMDAELASFLRTGVSIVMATRDERLVPTITRVLGLRVDGPCHLLLNLNERAAGGSVRNLETTGEFAISAASSLGYRSVQLKGHCLSIESADDEAIACAERWRELFAEVSARFGVTPVQVRNLWLKPDRVARVRIESAFGQTPGPGAGAPLESSTEAAK